MSEHEKDSRIKKPATSNSIQGYSALFHPANSQMPTCDHLSHLTCHPPARQPRPPLCALCLCGQPPDLKAVKGKKSSEVSRGLREPGKRHSLDHSTDSTFRACLKMKRVHASPNQQPATPFRVIPPFSTLQNHGHGVAITCHSRKATASSPLRLCGQSQSAKYCPRFSAFLRDNKIAPLIVRKLHGNHLCKMPRRNSYWLMKGKNAPNKQIKKGIKL